MIAVVYDGFYPGSGGVETHIRDLVSGDSREFEVVADALPGLPLSERLSPTVIVTRIPPANPMMSSRPHLLLGRAGFPARFAGDVIRNRRRLEYLTRTRHELVHVHGMNLGASVQRTLRWVRSTSLARRALDLRAIRAPKVVTVHGLGSLAVDESFNRAIERAFVGQFPHIICVDREVERRVASYLQGLGHGSRIHFVPNGIDLARFSRRPLRLGPPLRVGFAGRLEASRGIDVLVDVLSDPPEGVEFVIAGLGNARQVERFRGRLPPRGVRFLPNLPWSGMPDFLSGIDLLANPVVVPGMSRISLEAMAMGRPVIMSRRGDRYPVVDRDTGFLAHHTAASYRQILSELVADPGLVAAAGSRAADLVAKEFGVERMRARIESVYREALGEV